MSDSADSLRDARFEAIIAGGSFAGLAAALQLARARRRVLLLDGGQPRNRFAAASHGFLTQDGQSPAAILDQARAQLFAYPTITSRPVRAITAEPLSDGIRLTLEDGRTAIGSKLILAHGVVDRLPAIDGLAERWGEGVLHCPYCHGYETADRRLGVLWSGETSVHRATLVRDWSDDVTLFTHGAALDEETRGRLRARGIEVDERVIVELLGEGRHLAALRTAEGALIPVDALFVAPRTELSSDLAQQLGCATESGPAGLYVKTDDFRLSSTPGVYAAGDVARPGHTVSFAVADGVTAGIAAHQAIIAQRSS